jgi:cobalamin synthase
VARTFPRVTRAGQERSAKARLIGGISGVVVCVPLLIYGIGFVTHPYHIELALIAAVVYLVITVFFNRWLYRTTMQRARRLSDDTTSGSRDWPI